MNLQGIEVSEVARGDALVEKGWFQPTLMLDSDLEVLSLLADSGEGSRRECISIWGRPRSSREPGCSGGVKAIAPGERGLVQLRLEAPIVAARGDRFILRRYSPLETIAGGVVLDAYS